MGDHLTRSADAEYLRAHELREALRRGRPPGLIEAGATQVREVTPAWDQHHPEIQQAYLEQFVECAPEAITILDAQYRIVRVNEQFTRMFGFAADEAVGQPIDALIVPEEFERES